MATTVERPAARHTGADDVQVLGPSPDGGVCLSTSGRQLFSSMPRLPGRLDRVVAMTEGVAHPRGRLFPVAVVADPALARTILTRPSGFRTGRGIEVEDGSTRAVSSRTIGPTLDYPVYAGFVDAETEDPPPAAEVVRPEVPDLGEGPHLFYGLQWWFFGALALFGFGYLAWDERRHGPRGGRPTRRSHRSGAPDRAPEPAPSDRSREPVQR